MAIHAYSTRAPFNGLPAPEICRRYVTRRVPVAPPPNVIDLDLRRQEALAKKEAKERRERLERIGTDAEWAAGEFEPWTYEPDAMKALTNQKAVGHAICIRMAYAANFRTKAELIDGMGDLGDGVVLDLMENWADTLRFADMVKEVVGTAQARMFSVTAYLDIHGWPARPH